MSTDLTWIVPAALVALGLAVVVVWCAAARWRFRRRLRSQIRQLSAFDPAARSRAAAAIVRRGLHRRSAHILLGHLAIEEDERVRFAIAHAVDSERDKKARGRRVRRLRAWATEELADAWYEPPAPPEAPPRSKGADSAKPTGRGKKPPKISWRAPTAP